MLYVPMKKRLLELDIAHCDEIRIQTLKEPDRAPTPTSYMWLFASATCEVPLYIFEYHTTRGCAVMHDFLKGWEKTIVIDGHATYRDPDPSVNRVSCIVHMRRKIILSSLTLLNLLSEMPEEKTASVDMLPNYLVAALTLIPVNKF